MSSVGASVVSFRAVCSLDIVDHGLLGFHGCSLSLLYPWHPTSAVDLLGSDEADARDREERRKAGGGRRGVESKAPMDQLSPDAARGPGRGIGSRVSVWSARASAPLSQGLWIPMPRRPGSTGWACGHPNDRGCARSSAALFLAAQVSRVLTNAATAKSWVTPRVRP